MFIVLFFLHNLQRKIENKSMQRTCLFRVKNEGVCLKTGRKRLPMSIHIVVNSKNKKMTIHQRKS